MNAMLLQLNNIFSNIINIQLILIGQQLLIMTKFLSYVDNKTSGIVKSLPNRLLITKKTIITA